LEFCIFVTNNIQNMETFQIREELHKFVDIGDETFIRVFYAMATEYKKNSPQIMTPHTKAEFINDIKEAERQIKQGDFQTIDEFEKEAEQWT